MSENPPDENTATFPFGVIETIWDGQRRLWFWRCPSLPGHAAQSEIGHATQADAYQAGCFIAHGMGRWA